MSYLGDSLRQYWCGPSGHDFTVPRRRADAAAVTVVCRACQKRQSASTCLFCPAEASTGVAVVSPEGGEVQGVVCDACLPDAKPGYQGWRTYVLQRVA